MAAKSKKTTLVEAQNPLILRCHRLMEAFAKSDDERDFYLDRNEGFITYVDLDKSEEELKTLFSELRAHSERYCMIPKLTFYETKKLMEGFVHEKVYDIDTKEKLLDIIQSKEAREHFLEFIYDHLGELEKWQQFYQERSRIRIIEWLRNFHFHFVFEEDLDVPKPTLERLKENLFQKDVSKDLAAVRKTLVVKAKTYYSNEALNPRPKRGRPPKQVQKLDIEPQASRDIYTTVTKEIRPFLFTPDITSALDVTFSSKFESREEIISHSRASSGSDQENSIEDFNRKLASLRSISSKWREQDEEPTSFEEPAFVDEGNEEEIPQKKKPRSAPKKKPPAKKATTPTKLRRTTKAIEKEEKPKAKASSKPQKLRRTTSKNTEKPKAKPATKAKTKAPVKPKSKTTKVAAKKSAKPKRKLLRRTKKTK